MAVTVAKAAGAKTATNTAVVLGPASTTETDRLFAPAGALFAYTFTGAPLGRLVGDRSP